MKLIKSKQELERLVDNPTEILRRSYSTWLNSDGFKSVPIFSKKYLYCLDLPFGKVVMLGSFDGSTLKEWKQHFGAKRVLGYDIINPSNDPSIIVKDARTLNETDDCPCALVCNDLPVWIVIPETRKVTLEWSLRNIVLGGYYLDSPNHRCGWDLRGYMLNYGFEEFLWNNIFVIYKRIK